MREECKNFQSRTYASGEVARFCVLDLAPEAPWKCPDDCPKFEPRLADVAWVHGSIVPPAVGEEPSGVLSDDTQAMLRDAESIVNEEASREDLPRKKRGLFRRRRSS
jgi:hypothetical protein